MRTAAAVDYHQPIDMFVAIMVLPLKITKSPLADYWRELAKEVRNGAELLPEGEAKKARMRVFAQYERLAILADQMPKPAED
ncbi:MAG: hypothetical protein K2P94_14510 [Rhodospirillaceae bacterium]|nr:hypothetical protein [Rhodospirillaceae bacterium]